MHGGNDGGPEGGGEPLVQQSPAVWRSSVPMRT